MLNERYNHQTKKTFPVLPIALDKNKSNQFGPFKFVGMIRQTLFIVMLQFPIVIYVFDKMKGVIC